MQNNPIDLRDYHSLSYTMETLIYRNIDVIRSKYTCSSLIDRLQSVNSFFLGMIDENLINGK